MHKFTLMSNTAVETTLQIIKWKDSGGEETQLFAIGEWDGITNDDNIFFWVESMAEIAENDFQDLDII